MECKIVVGTKEGKTYNIEAKDEQARLFLGRKVGDTVNATPLGLKGYEVKITGGSDKSGFPIRRDVQTSGRGSALLSSKTIGYRQKGAGIRKRKTVVGSTISENIAQVNALVVKAGKDPIEKLLAVGGEAPAEGEAGAKAEEAAPEAKPAEEAKEEAKPVEKPAEAAPETPAEEAKEAGAASEAVEEKPAE